MHLDMFSYCSRPFKQTFFMVLVVGLFVALIILGSSILYLDLDISLPKWRHGHPVVLSIDGRPLFKDVRLFSSHQGDDTVAKELAEKVRVLIWVKTSPQNLQTRARAIRDTWGRRANKLLFFSSKTDAELPAVGLNVSEGREHLTAKAMKAFRYVYQHHFKDADWFMTIDDDGYVIVENLRYFLSGENTSEPVYFGHHFKVIVKQGYYSGGGGYVLSKEALRRLGEKGQDKKLCRQDGGADDAEIGICLQNLGVRTGNSTDALGRSRFHCFDPETFLFGGFPDWYYRYDANGAHKGDNAISDYAISFHYVPPSKMKTLDFYIYHLSPYGIAMSVQNLNQ